MRAIAIALVLLLVLAFPAVAQGGGHKTCPLPPGVVLQGWVCPHSG